MDSRIGVGIISGLIIWIVLYTANSDKFSRTQKISIYVSSVFFPLQILLFIIYLIYNSHKKEDPLKPSEDEIYNNRIKSLVELKESGVLTVEEYIQKSKDIENSKLEAQIKESSSYKKLKNLFDVGILTKEEFENKVEILKSNLQYEDEEDKGDIYFEGFRVFKDVDLNYGFENEDGTIFIEPIYEFAEDFKEGLALVRQDGKFGFIDKLGNITIDIKFEDAKSFKNGSAMVVKNNKVYYINKRGIALE